MITETDCRDLDRQDPLGFVRDRFDLTNGVIYLDGNSLGPPVRAVRQRIAKLADDWQSEPPRVDRRHDSLTGGTYATTIPILS